eukprot:364228-Chlamydomonas_euryale.AAC.21
MHNAPQSQSRPPPSTTPNAAHSVSYRAPQTEHAQGLAVKLSLDGAPVSTLWDPSGDVVVGVSAAEEHNGRLWLGNLIGTGISYIDL